MRFIGRWRHLSHDTKEGIVGALRVGQIWFICAALVVMKEESQYLVFAPNHFLVKEGRWPRWEVQLINMENMLNNSH